jgi:hypothetical protein
MRHLKKFRVFEEAPPFNVDHRDFPPRKEPKDSVKPTFNEEELSILREFETGDELVMLPSADRVIKVVFHEYEPFDYKITVTKHHAKADGSKSTRSRNVMQPKIVYMANLSSTERPGGVHGVFGMELLSPLLSSDLRSLMGKIRKAILGIRGE